MYAVLAAIPYTTFPDLELIPGLGTFNVFGLMVALGVLLGAWFGATYGERFGIHRDETYRVATYMVVVGIIGSRLTWVLTHLDEVDNPIDVIAIWEGGIQFAGGFIAGLAVGVPLMLKWDRLQRWNVLNGYAMGLALGVAIGRIGCYAVGEHFGRETGFFLGTRYDGGEVREPELGDALLLEGTTFHNTSLYEMMQLAVLFAVMGFLVLRIRNGGLVRPLIWAGALLPALAVVGGVIFWQGPNADELPGSLPFLVAVAALAGLLLLACRYVLTAGREGGPDVQPGLFVGLFFVWYGVFRFLTDTLRVNDERVLMMTGAQWMSLVLVPFGLYVLLVHRPKLVRLAAEKARSAPGTAAGLLDEDDDDEADEVVAPDKLEAPDEDAEVRDGDVQDDPDEGPDGDPQDDAVTEEAEGDLERAEAEPASDDPEGDEIAAGDAKDTP